MFPVSCFSCNNRVGRLEEKYYSLLESGLTKKEALDTLNIKRFCCRRMFLGHVDVIGKLLLVPADIPSSPEQKLEKSG
jgi:DNA-directed RNA polymerase I, II, and III subunit RPABC5